MIAVSAVQARTPKDLIQNGDLTDGNNYSPPGLPTSANDLVFSTATTDLTLNGASLSVGSINQTNNLAYTVSNNAPGTANSTLTIGGSGTNATPAADPADIIYLGGATSTLTFQGPNGDDGIGVLGVTIGPPGGRFDVAQAGATLNMSSDMDLGTTTSLTKTGAGIMNFSGRLSGFGSNLVVNAGTLNLLSHITPSYVVLGVNNLNPNAGTAVTLNLYNSAAFRGVSGTVATPSMGTNSATVNLIGAATRLTLFIGAGGGNGSYAGIIAGDGSVSFQGIGKTQTFTGNNTYTGTTAVTEGTLAVDGITSGQGSYDSSRGGTSDCILTGNGTIGLKADANITIGANSSTLAPGRISTVGTLTVNASGTGGVVLGNGSVLAIDVGSGGMSDRLDVIGGAIDLTSSNDTLKLTPLANSFDGLDYTIATFAQNVNAGVFGSVQGIGFPYAVQYNLTSIKLVALQLPLQFTSVFSRKIHGSAGAFDIDLLIGEPVECRSSGGSHTLVFNFTNYLVSGSASVTAGIGNVVGKPILSGKSMTVNLDGVADAQRLSVTLHNVTDRFSQVLPDTVMTIRLLVGDTNGNKSVNSSDVAQVKGQSGLVTSSANFREDLNMNGVISASDVGLVKARSGTVIPP